MEKKSAYLFDEFAEVETETEYNGYLYSVKSAIIITICGMFCGLKNMKGIHMWASNERIKEFLNENFHIESVPCYSWFTQILGFIKPESFSESFTNWIVRLVQGSGTKTLAFDGKTIRSTGKMKRHENPIHIVSAQLAEYGVTIGQITVEGKSNEIPAVQKLIDFLDVKGCMIVADALNCQKETAKKVIDGGGDYLLSAKDNQKTLKAEIADYVADKSLRASMDTCTKREKNRGRIECRTAYTTSDIDWLYGRDGWAGLVSIGAVNTKFTTENGKTDGWHYYISSRKLTASELLDFARKEWSVESMHWLLDVHFSEDFCRACERRTQENLNIIRKIIINILRLYKSNTNPKAAFSHLMLECMIDPLKIFDFCNFVKNN